MSQLCKYYKQVRQVSYDSGVTWVNLGEVQKGDLYEYNSPSCGGVTEYRWVNMDSSTDYYCEGTTKYYKQKKQQSTDGGSTWQDVSPAEYQRGTVVEYQSTDCGYVPPTPGTSGNYLTFVAEETGTFKFSGTTGNDSISYSLDSGSTWNTLASGVDSPTVQSGQKIMWKGELTPTPTSGNWGIGVFSSTSRFAVEGNIMSVLYGDNFSDKKSLSGKVDAFRDLFKGCTGMTSAENLVLPATTLAERCYYYMFYGCTNLTTVSSDLLPATTLERHCYCDMFCGCTSLTTAPALPATTLAAACYFGMFQGCTSLTTAPTLPATTMVDSCYRGMFANCTSLTTAPALPATNLGVASYCYGEMFAGCTSLTTAPSVLPATRLTIYCYSSMFENCPSLTRAPELPATTLRESCYQYMFSRCTSLNYIKCLATDVSAGGCTSQWLFNVSSSGTFVKNSSMNSWGSGNSGIPNNWTVQNA